MTEQQLMAIVNEALLDATAPFSRSKDPLSMKEFCLSFAERVAAAEREAWAVAEPTQKKPQREWQWPNFTPEETTEKESEPFNKPSLSEDEKEFAEAMTTLIKAGYGKEASILVRGK